MQRRAARDPTELARDLVPRLGFCPNGYSTDVPDQDPNEHPPTNYWRQYGPHLDEPGRWLLFLSVLSALETLEALGFSYSSLKDESIRVKRSSTGEPEAIFLFQKECIISTDDGPESDLTELLEMRVFQEFKQRLNLNTDDLSTDTIRDSLEVPRNQKNRIPDLLRQIDLFEDVRLGIDRLNLLEIKLRLLDALCSDACTKYMSTLKYEYEHYCLDRQPALKFVKDGIFQCYYELAGERCWGFQYYIDHQRLYVGQLWNQKPHGSGLMVYMQHTGAEVFFGSPIRAYIGGFRGGAFCSEENFMLSTVVFADTFKPSVHCTVVQIEQEPYFKCEGICIEVNNPEKRDVVWDNMIQPLPDENIMLDGHVRMNQADGFAKMLFAQNESGHRFYSGNWKENKFHGHGILVLDTGDILTGRFDQGTFIEGTRWELKKFRVLKNGLNGVQNTIMEVGPNLTITAREIQAQNQEITLFGSIIDKELGTNSHGKILQRRLYGHGTRSSRNHMIEGIWDKGQLTFAGSIYVKLPELRLSVTPKGPAYPDEMTGRIESKVNLQDAPRGCLIEYDGEFRSFSPTIGRFTFTDGQGGEITFEGLVYSIGLPENIEPDLIKLRHFNLDQLDGYGIMKVSPNEEYFGSIVRGRYHSSDDVNDQREILQRVAQKKMPVLRKHMREYTGQFREGEIRFGTCNIPLADGYEKKFVGSFVNNNFDIGYLIIMHAETQTELIRFNNPGFEDDEVNDPQADVDLYYEPQATFIGNVQQGLQRGQGIKTYWLTQCLLVGHFVDFEPVLINHASTMKDIYWYYDPSTKLAFEGVLEKTDEKSQPYPKAGKFIIEATQQDVKNMCVDLDKHTYLDGSVSGDCYSGNIYYSEQVGSLLERFEALDAKPSITFSHDARHGFIRSGKGNLYIRTHRQAEWICKLEEAEWVNDEATFGKYHFTDVDTVHVTYKWYLGPLYHGKPHGRGIVEFFDGKQYRKSNATFQEGALIPEA